ncbi:lasso peptide biosynthesis PqqD family chaperone [Streptomyces sp. NPDC052101]|uniref:lasso peptide biosynthesis PqqD family chaperone n=1 Tax=Streptomyces sp. NPDC052101 TaxID=3155763 RepID=UPI0034125140
MTTIALRAQVTGVATDGGMVLLDERSGRYWQLNATARLVLQHLLDGQTPEQAATALADAYPDAASRAASDVEQLLASLRSLHLLAD